MTTALVTGAGGFVGPHLCRLLLAEGIAVTAWTHGESSALTVLAQESAGALVLKPVDLLGDLPEPGRPDYAFHLAAQSFVPLSFAEPEETYRVNVLGTLRLLELLRRLETPPRLLLPGSAEEYGLIAPASLPVDESCPLRPATPYAGSKAAQGLLGLQYHLTYDLPVIRTRSFNHTGAGQGDRFAIPAFARQIAEAEVGRRSPVLAVGNLDARRDFTDVRDIVRAYWLLARDGQLGEVYNVASGTAVTLQAVLEQLISVARIPVSYAVDPRLLRPSDVPVLEGDNGRLRAATGWTPRYSLDETLQSVLDDWRSRIDG